MFSKVKTLALGLIAMAMGFAANVAHAQTAPANPIIVMLESIDLTAVAAGVAVIGLLIVAISLTFKGPDVAKRVISKV